MKDQKFRAGDLVRISASLPPGMSHFKGAGKKAVVLGSYGDVCMGHPEPSSGEPDYCLYIKGVGRCSWFGESLLTLLAFRLEDVMRVWDEEGAPATQAPIDPKTLGNSHYEWRLYL